MVAPHDASRSALLVRAVPGVHCETGLAQAKFQQVAYLTDTQYRNVHCFSFQKRLPIAGRD